MPHPHTRRPDAALPATALFALLLVCLLALTAAGAAVYVRIAGSAADGRSRRAALDYLCARVRAADEANAVTLADGPEGPVLVLAEPLADSGFATRIYLYDGHLVEDYAPENSALSPDTAQPLAETALFAATFDGSLLTVQTTQGAAQIYLHSGEGAP